MLGFTDGYSQAIADAQEGQDSLEMPTFDLSNQIARKQFMSRIVKDVRGQSQDNAQNDMDLHPRALDRIQAGNRITSVLDIPPCKSWECMIRNWNESQWPGVPPLKEWTVTMRNPWELNPRKIRGNPFSNQFAVMPPAEKDRLEKQLRSRKVKFSNHRLVNQEYEELGGENFRRVYEASLSKPINDLLGAIRTRRKERPCNL